MWIIPALNSPFFLSISPIALTLFCILPAPGKNPQFPLSDSILRHCSVHYLGLHLNLPHQNKSKIIHYANIFQKKDLFAAYVVTCHITTSVFCGKRVTTYQRELIMIRLYCMALLTAFCRDTWKHGTNLGLYICLLHREVSLN